METPFDVLNHRLGKIRDNGDIDFDNTAAAMDIDEEMQAKFIFFPIEELEAWAKDIREPEPGTFHLGDGPEKCSAQSSENPTWLYNHAANALALWWHLKQLEEAAKEREKIEARPAPGLYKLQVRGTSKLHLCIVTAERKVMVQQDESRTDFNDHTDIYDNLGKNMWNFYPLGFQFATLP